jgi:protoheme IX farnesyltransferase
VFSIFYLFMLFAALLIDHGRGSFPLMRLSHGGLDVPMHSELGSSIVRNACSFINLSTGEA